MNSLAAPSSASSNLGQRRSTQAAARLEARISQELHALLKRASQLQGRSVTDFVVMAVHAAASKAVEQAEQLALSVADQERFAQALMSPAPPNAALQKAFARRKKLIVQSHTL